MTKIDSKDYKKDKLKKYALPLLLVAFALLNLKFYSEFEKEILSLLTAAFCIALAIYTLVSPKLKLIKAMAGFLTGIVSLFIGLIHFQQRQLFFGTIFIVIALSTGVFTSMNLFSHE